MSDVDHNEAYAAYMFDRVNGANAEEDEYVEVVAPPAPARAPLAPADARAGAPMEGASGSPPPATYGSAPPPWMSTPMRRPLPPIDGDITYDVALSTVLSGGEHAMDDRDVSMLGEIEHSLATHLGSATLSIDDLQSTVASITRGGMRVNVEIGTLTRKADQDEAIAWLTDELLAPHNPAGALLKVAPARVYTTLRKLYTALPTTAPSTDGDQRDEGPVDDGFRTPSKGKRSGDDAESAARTLRDAAEANHEYKARSREIPMTDLLNADGTGILNEMVKEYGKRHAPTLTSLASQAQLKLLQVHIVEHGRFPYTAALMPDRLNPLQGVGGMSVTRPKVDKTADALEAAATEAEAAPTAKGRDDYRSRVRMLAHSVGVATFGKPNGKRIYDAALDFSAAVDAARSLDALPALISSVEAAWQEALVAVNDECSTGVAGGFALATASVKQSDADRRKRTREYELHVKAKGTEPRAEGAQPVKPPTGGDPLANPERPPKKPKTDGRSSAVTGKNDPSRKPVKLADGTMRFYKQMKGGNKMCPVACPHNHGHDAMCEYSHEAKKAAAAAAPPS